MGARTMRTSRSPRINGGLKLATHSLKKLLPNKTDAISRREKRTKSVLFTALRTHDNQFFVRTPVVVVS